MQSITHELESKGKAVKEASRKTARLSSEARNRALHSIANALIARSEEILSANEIDRKEAMAEGMGDAMLDRLLLDSHRLSCIADNVRAVASLPDPLGDIFDQSILPNGLRLSKRRVPLGVMGAIYESRPNVTVDISVLCLKSGNAVMLRGGKEAIHSNKALAVVLQETAYQNGIPHGTVQFIESTDRSIISQMLKMKDYINLVIPRGGANLIKFVRDNASMPVVAGGVGVCHTYIDCNANVTEAIAITHNAKVQRPTVCNALDTILVHKDMASEFLSLLAEKWSPLDVEMRCDERAHAILSTTPYMKIVKKSCEEDWGKEFLSLIAAVKVVNSLDEAMEHIENYSSGHSEAIVTNDYTSAMRFADEVDAACVYVNASTRFTDGGQFGLGAEVGISTQKFHARGPLGLKELTSYKWVIMGNGQIRP